ncbi:MAG TPA: hypothetical protein VF765_19445 [Polyangiaceae bacterium]
MRATVDRDALVVGMTLVPGLWARNRSFALFEDPEVRRARRRSSLLRGLVRQLAGAHGRIDELHVSHGGDSVELRYRVPGLSVARRSTLTPLELACVRYLAARAGVPGLHASDEERAAIDAALRRLASGVRLSELDTADPNGL